MDSDVTKVYLWANGMLMVFDKNGEQIPELQGRHTKKRVKQIESRSTEATIWHGFGRSSGPPVEMNPRG